MKIILSISGGGIKGIIPLVILAEIEKRLGGNVINHCDLIAGTSTGGIISCLLNAVQDNGQPKYSALTALNMYKEFGKSVFHRSKLRKILTLDGLIWNKYSDKNLENLLKKYFGEDRLDGAFTDMIIPTYQISGKPYPHFFKTKHAKIPTKSTENPCLWEVARCTSAANSYFKPYKLGEQMTLLDGGIFANNPAMCAYAEAKRVWTDEDIVVISIGTGENLIGHDYEKIKHWGLLSWAIPFFEQTSISADATVDYMLKTFSEDKSADKYFCLQTEIDKACMKMDDVCDANLEFLQMHARDFISENSGMIDEICVALRGNAK